MLNQIVGECSHSDINTRYSELVIRLAEVFLVTLSSNLCCDFANILLNHQKEKNPNKFLIKVSVSYRYQEIVTQILQLTIFLHFYISMPTLKQ